MVQHNKAALVTGASRGVGRATALALAETGAHVLVHYGRSAQEVRSLVEKQICHIVLEETEPYESRHSSWRSISGL